MKRTFAAALCLLLLASCRDLEVVTASYNTLADARAAGAIASGRLPEGLPPGATDLREAFDPGTNARWGLFNFPASEAADVRALLEPDELSLGGEECNPPRRIEWWPILLRGRLDPERIAAAGLKAHRTRDGALIVVLNWGQGRAYYWSSPRGVRHGAFATDRSLRIVRYGSFATDRSPRIVRYGSLLWIVAAAMTDLL